MAKKTGLRRTDAGERIIRAPPSRIYRALTEAAAIVRWRPPRGMRGEVGHFDRREGGTFRMTWIYEQPDHEVAGKTTEHSDTFEGTFVELVPDKRVVEEIRFQSEDPALAEPMTITTSLTPAADSTRVRVACRNVPAVIRKADHLEGIRSSLENLAAFVE